MLFLTVTKGVCTVVTGIAMFFMATFMPMDVNAEELPDGDYHGEEYNDEDMFNDGPDYVEQQNMQQPTKSLDPSAEKAYLESLPVSPDRSVSAEDLFSYYRVTKKEVGIYNLQPGKVYYMYYRPLFFGAFYQNDNFVVVDKVWEQERGGIIGWFGDFTVRTIQYTDVVTGSVCLKMPLTAEVRFYEIEKVNKLTDPNIVNQFS